MSHPGNQPGAKGANGSGAGSVSLDGAEERSYQELWLKLARRDWASMVLVPADHGVSAERVAHALAAVGKRLSPDPVTAVSPSSLEYGTAMALADMPSFVGRRRLAGANWPTVDLPASAVHVAAPVEPGAGGAEKPARALAIVSSARLIISLPAVVTEPLGLATTQAADLVVICIDLGRTNLASARRTIDLIGRERIAGCLLLS